MASRDGENAVADVSCELDILAMTAYFLPFLSDDDCFIISNNANNVGL